jgi:hypothetical protein
VTVRLLSQRLPSGNRWINSQRIEVGRWYLCQRCLDTSHMRLEIRRRDAQRWRAPELRRHLLTIVDADGSQDGTQVLPSRYDSAASRCIRTADHARAEFFNHPDGKPDRAGERG